MAITATPTKLTKVQVLSYHGNSFVIGLLWHPLGSLTGYMREARQFGRVEKMDIVAIRATQSVIQAGFVSNSAGAMKGMYSLASTLAGQLGDSWIAAWRVSREEDRYALVAVDQGAVLPGCDQVGTTADIQRKVAQLLSSTIAFKYTYLPPEFGRGGDVFDVESLLQPRNLRREYRLRPLAFGLSRGELIRLSLAGALVVGALIGWQQWEAHKARLDREAAIALQKQRQAELEALNARSNQQQTLQALEHPWSKRPGIADFIAGCNGAIDRIPLSISGWTFTSAQCDGDLVSATFKRTGNSTANGFIAATRGHYADEPAFFDGGNSAAVKVSLKLDLAGDEPLLEASEALALMTSWLHGQGLEPTLKELPVQAPAPATLPGGKAPPAAPLPKWKHFELQFSSPLPPAIALRNAPGTGVRLREIKTQLQNDQLTWSVTGDLYAN
ncbi:pilus assembly protein PilO [Pseudomonas gingeri NCPPB 3146 = LMG 5327]|uniref:Type 4b pilus protein PilO2 n=2 Tax=Pseudomonas gingeri TaxID=117681 RepID=A0A7Y7Y3N5_9PSED|nr:type 4b pilus protein PilO2 [Pseudomonas gingeri]NWC16508.1 type 4b pilus protein PilO2 [Pseudomonas gingeri]PNQ91131.1 pilus assembly protein PilO [Pseudomonas gingeri NCPPB 3146 = LMG 5327]